MTGSVELGGKTYNAAATDALVIKLAADGSVLWGAAYGSGNIQVMAGLAAGSAGTIFSTGSFGGDLDFGGNKMTSKGSSDIFLVQFEP